MTLTVQAQPYHSPDCNAGNNAWSSEETFPLPDNSSSGHHKHQMNCTAVTEPITGCPHSAYTQSEVPAGSAERSSELATAAERLYYARSLGPDVFSRLLARIEEAHSQVCSLWQCNILEKNARQHSCEPNLAWSQHSPDRAFLCSPI
jgi:hypothetical protein